tara:strand:+ start:2473 stop:3336 length:864 start_codon:yes stop_codon:yes gene_type:complete
MRFLELKNHVVYYSSNYFGYYQLPNQSVNRTGNEIFTDNLGNRNPKENTLENSEIFFVGDSVTYGGSVVNNDDMFANLIAKKLQKKYLNISSNGWGIVNMVNFINFHNLYKKDSIYVLTCIIDCFTRNLRRAKQNYFFKDKSQYAVINLYKYIVFLINNHNYSVNNVTETFVKKDNYETINYSIDQLIELEEKLKLINSKLILIYSPNSKSFKKYISNSELYMSDYKKFILNRLSTTNIKYIDIINFFSEKDKINFGNFYVDSVHLSKQGHELYSNILTPLINENIR